MVPIGNPLEFYECEECRATFPVALDSGSRSRNERSSSEHFKLDALTLCCLIVAADGYFAPEEIEALLDISRRLELSFDREKLGALCSDLDQQRFQALPYLRCVTANWTQPQCRLMSQLAFIAASSTGELNAAQAKVMAALPDELGLSHAEYMAAIEELSQ
jgi:tellurite resistance protein